jgi:aminopeptidase N
MCNYVFRKFLVHGLFLLMLASGLAAQSQHAPPTTQQAAGTPTRANILRGEYGRYRANNDLLFYHLDIRIDPDRKLIAGKNTIRFRMLKDDPRIQLDLYDNLKIDKILYMVSGAGGRGPGNGTAELKYERESGAVFVDFPETLKAGRVYSIDFYYSGTPQTIGRFGGFTFGKDSKGRHWVFTACEGEGASIWWPNKDQWRDEVESMRISIAIPSSLTDVSNGKFLGKTDLGDGFTRWDWLVHYPINNYNVSVNIGNYTHFSEELGDLSLDYYVLPENLAPAKRQFAQTRGMLKAFQHYFGEYPFKKDGYKLIEVPYAGMEHQSAVTYGNRFANGYLERDWTGVGVSPRFDFIIIHESGHEWFGNSVSAADTSDMWIHEGWTTYLECLYVEYMYGYEDYLKYTNGYRSKVRNQQPIIAPRGVNATPPQDQYFKGALFINTLRSIVNDDKKWWVLMRDFYQHFKYRNIMTEDVVAYFNRNTWKNLTPIFDQYLRHKAIPILELKFQDGAVSYRWRVDEPKFAMPVRVGRKGNWRMIYPTTNWKTMKTPLQKDQFEVATDLYFIDVQMQ